MKLGSKEDAQLIYKRRRTGLGPLPKGWKKLGEGSYRATYLSPDGVVYKVCHADEYYDANYSEFINYKRLRNSKVKLPKGWQIAPAQLYTFDHKGNEVNIIAMKYVQGTHRFFQTEEQSEAWLTEIGALKAFRMCDIWDVHEGNFVITPTGKKVIIDLGE